MQKQGWLTKQFDAAKRDVKELPRWLQDKRASGDSSRSSGDSHVVQLREAKVSMTQPRTDAIPPSLCEQCEFPMSFHQGLPCPGPPLLPTREQLQAKLDAQATRLAQVEQENERLRGRTHDAIGYSDAYYLEMAALDNYPVEDGLLKSTSVVYRIHQLGHALEATEQRLAEAEAREHALTAAMEWVESYYGEAMQEQGCPCETLLSGSVKLCPLHSALAAEGHAERKAP